MAFFGCCLLAAVICAGAEQCLRSDTYKKSGTDDMALLATRARMGRETKAQARCQGDFGACEYLVKLSSGFSVGLSTRGNSAFRIRLSTDYQPIDTPMVAPHEPDAPWGAANSSLGQGIVSGAGSVVVSAMGVLTLMDSEGKVLTTSKPITSPGEMTFASAGGGVYGRGADADDATLLRWHGNVTPVVNNQFGKGSQSHAPHYYTPDGYAALGVSNGLFTTANGSFLSATYDAGPHSITWRNIREGPFEVYLMPAIGLESGTAAYYDLIGRPRVPPLWTFGFMASRWGWKDFAYVNDTLTRFRSGGFPIDAFITDFEWYSNESDYSFTAAGKSYCHDFQFRKELIPDGEETLTYFKTDLHIQFGGIRKARLCNSELLEYARSQGWILPQGCPGGDPTVPGWTPAVGTYGVGRELNFTDPVVRSWYSHQQEHFLNDGVSFWWNDEGETDYFTFLWWATAQEKTQHAMDSTKRYYSLNRNFAPGMARLGVGFWTGDSGPEWWVLAAQPGYMLNWALAGAPYVGSDIGGFTANTTAELLTRWYQVGVFMPIMRVHSTLNATPHWPWLFGEDAGKAMKKALELRYRLIPYHYSFAHGMFLNRRLWMRSMGMAFPEDVNLANLTNQWMDGELLVAPVLNNESQKHVYLPTGTWFPLEGGAAVNGPKEVRGVAKLDEIPVFAPAGSIVVLAPQVQYTDSLPGGPLEVRVFQGQDATFELFEDDGESQAYLSGVIRSTIFRWKESESELSWHAEGTATTRYTSIDVSVISASGSASLLKHSELGSTGAIRF